MSETSGRFFHYFLAGSPGLWGREWAVPAFATRSQHKKPPGVSRSSLFFVFPLTRMYKESPKASRLTASDQRATQDKGCGLERGTPMPQRVDNPIAYEVQEAFLHRGAHHALRVRRPALQAKLLPVPRPIRGVSC